MTLKQQPASSPAHAAGQREAGIPSEPADVLHLSGDEYRQWLTDLCLLIPNTRQGLLVTLEASGEFQPVARYQPDESASSEDPSLLLELVQEVTDQESPLLTPADAEDHYAVAFPLHQRGLLVAVPALVLETRDDAELKQAMRLLQWGSRSLLALSEGSESLPSDQAPALSANQNTSARALVLYSRVVAEERFDDAAMRLISELALWYKCDLVSLGLYRKHSVRISHLSNSASFGEQMNLIRQLEAAMNESVDQRQPVIYPALDASQDTSSSGSLSSGSLSSISLAHRALADSQGEEAVMTIPLFDADDECVGAVTLQRHQSQPFDAQDQDEAVALLGLATASLIDKQERSRPLYQQALQRLGYGLGKLFGPGQMKLKLISLAAVATLLFLIFAQGDYRLSADARLKSVVQRSLVAPFEGYIQTAEVKAGDRVSKGDLLLTLDPRDLELERLRWLSQQNKLARQIQEAAAEYNRSRSNILEAQMEQATAQLALVENRLARSRVVAPFDGLIVSGDLSQRLGSSVAQGDPLFEIAPVDAYKVELLVKESRIMDVQPGQRGTLYLSALPEQAFDFQVRQRSPVIEVKDGKSHYRIEALVIQNPESMRPGMEGVGKIAIDRRNLFSIWTRDLREWWMLQRWSWWG